MISFLRLNYMFPVPIKLVSIRIIADELGRAYRPLLSQELRHCIKEQGTIQHLVKRTYKHVSLGKDLELVVNSRDFRLLEQAYFSYIQKEH